MGLQPDGETEALEEAQTTQSQMTRYVVDKEWASTNWTLFKGMKQLRFWAIFSIMFTIGTGYVIVLIHQVAYIVDIGFTALFASSLLLIYGIFSMTGRLCGFISDIVGRELAYAMACGGVILGYLMLIIAGTISSAWILYMYAVFFGFFSGLHSPTYAAAVADIFQGKHFGAILGFANIGYGLGSAFGAWFGGYVFDSAASYVPAFAIAMISLALAWVSLWVSSPRKIRRVAGRAPKLK
jgi:MFS family permease